MKLNEQLAIDQSYRNNESTEVVGLILRVIVVSKLKYKSETLASCDAQVHIRGVE